MLRCIYTNILNLAAAFWELIDTFKQQELDKGDP